jgi:hypothetical protein
MGTNLDYERANRADRVKRTHEPDQDARHARPATVKQQQFIVSLSKQLEVDVPPIGSVADATWIIDRMKSEIAASKRVSHES